ncbi:transporter [Nocardioides mangrovicus]|uniref:Transporter n=1 Tax=Nocardioides mangrovicus TaxID=2478913 RepID=A0A3L8P382_9ACTN|nr:MotA/TolQ/ExbB proton channel family protein [Nocardioides mangrovicus]RLV49313.1 transporter [Nocardioides mangrovicus]
MSHEFYRVVFKIAAVLELPVVVLTVLGLAVVLVEAGAFGLELAQHTRRRFPALVAATAEARTLLDEGRREEAGRRLQQVAWAPRMSRVLSRFAEVAGEPASEPLVAKQLADFDFACQRRLGRTRLLVRAGPALGLMGTLIPLSPALEGLARGNVSSLTDNLQLAFSVTVLGLLVGVVAFGLSLFRDRLYGQDFSDLEYVAAVLTGDQR